jgi:alpha-ribazole phosphatase/probable phosphoglycerate mutase
MVTITYYVHGTTTDNENHTATGQLPGELSELGLKQTKALAEQVASRNYDAIICSDLHRAVQTAEIVFGDKYDIVQDERLREADYGDWNGQPASLFKNRYEDFINTPFPGGETYKDVELRMRALCDDLARKYDGKHIALLAHHAPQMALEVICNGKTWEQAFAEDWRKTGAYQPGWRYAYSG